MKKLLYILFTFHVSLLPLNAQTSITWQRTYGGPLIDYGYSIVQTPDSGYIAVGRKVVLGAGNFIFAMRLDKYGDTIWTRLFNGYQATNVEVTNDGNYVISGSFSELFKINLNGDTLWTRRTDLTKRTSTVKQTADGGYILCGMTPNGPYTFAPYLLKLNALGGFQWEKTYTSGIGDGKFYDMTISRDNQFVMCGNYSPRQDTIYDYLFIMKTDENGNQLWFRGYDTLRYRYLLTVINGVDNGYLAGGYNNSSYLYKFDSLGYMQWFKFFDGPPKPGSCVQLINTINDGYALIGSWDSTFGNYFVRLMKVDDFGNERWRKVYGFNQNDFGEGLKQTFDSGYIIIGIRGQFNGDDIYIIKTDSNGNTSPYIGIKSISSEMPSEFKLYQNYPNPFNSSTKIRLQIPRAGYVKLRLYDVLAREINVLIQGELKPGIYEVKFESLNLSSGIYFYQFTVNGTVIDTRKMVLSK